jgi:hypothetical protein
MNNFTGMDNDATVIQEVTTNTTVPKMLMERDGRPVINVAENDME